MNTDYHDAACPPKQYSLGILIPLCILFALNNPAGHELLQDSLLKLRFHSAWQLAEQVMQRSITFPEFKENADIYLMLHHDNDAEKMLADMAVLNNKTPFCIPINDENPDDDAPQTPPTAPCHAVTQSQRKDKGVKTPHPA